MSLTLTTDMFYDKDHAENVAGSILVGLNIVLMSAAVVQMYMVNCRANSTHEGSLLEFDAAPAVDVSPAATRTAAAVREYAYSTVMHNTVEVIELRDAAVVNGTTTIAEQHSWQPDVALHGACIRKSFEYSRRHTTTDSHSPTTAACEAKISKPCALPTATTACPHYVRVVNPVDCKTFSFALPLMHRTAPHTAVFLLLVLHTAYTHLAS
eukprot:10095-Heterococcus_DN1.PRE.2